MSRGDILRAMDYLGHIVEAMRNRVAHGYFKVDFELVWKTIHGDLPQLRDQVAALIAAASARQAPD